MRAKRWHRTGVAVLLTCWTCVSVAGQGLAKGAVLNLRHSELERAEFKDCGLHLASANGAAMLLTAHGSHPAPAFAIPSNQNVDFVPLRIKAQFVGFPAVLLFVPAVPAGKPFVGTGEALLDVENRVGARFSHFELVVAASPATLARRVAARHGVNFVRKPEDEGPDIGPELLYYFEQAGGMAGAQPGDVFRIKVGAGRRGRSHVQFDCLLQRD